MMEKKKAPPDRNKIQSIQQASQMIKEVEEQQDQDKSAEGGNSKLIDIGDDDIFMITYNGVTFERRAGDVNINSPTVEENNAVKQKNQMQESTMIFNAGVSNTPKQTQRKKLKQLARQNKKDNVKLVELKEERRY